MKILKVVVIIKKNIRKRLGFVYLILGILSILYFIGSLITFGFAVNFSASFVFLGLLLMAVGVFMIRKPKVILKGWMSHLVVVFKFAAVAFIIQFIIVEGLIVHSSFEKYNKKADFVLVLGAAVKGKTMSLALYQRMEESLKYINKYPEVKIIVSGGKGQGEDISEAEAMREFLIKKGISEDRIISEDKSRNTKENIKNTKIKLKELYGKSDFNIVLITSNFHVFRAKLLADRFGLKVNTISAPIHIGIVPNSYFREYFAVIKSFIFDK